MSNCPLCDRISKSVVSNECAAAFYDAFPLTPDHILVVPKRHFGRLEQATDKEAEAIWDLVRQVQRMKIFETQPDAFNIGINDGVAAGQTIDHLHIHLIPRRKGDQIDPRGGVRWIFPNKARYWDSDANLILSEDPGNIKINHFFSIFDSVTTSYKILFFKSIIKLIKRNQFCKDRILFHEIVSEMLEGAYYAVYQFRLNLGSNDKIVDCLHEILGAEGSGLSQGQASTRLRQNQGQQYASNRLLRYVPQRLLQPWFRNELFRLPDQQKDALIRTLSSEQFDTKKPLYFIAEDGIELHPEWITYLQTNFPIIEKWANWHWLKYLEARNPSVPNLPAKLDRPQKRVSMSLQKRFWLKVLEVQSLNCIYTGEKIETTHFALDHFLPYLFVGHNQAWNLVPVSKSTNSIKGAAIPKKGFIKKLSDTHFKALSASRRVSSAREWQKIIEPYVADLKIPEAQILSQDHLTEHYHAVLSPLIDLAAGMGFSEEWSMPEN